MSTAIGEWLESHSIFGGKDGFTTTYHIDNQNQFISASEKHQDIFQGFSGKLHSNAMEISIYTCVLYQCTSGMCNYVHFVYGDSRVYGILWLAFISANNGEMNQK